LSDLLQVYVGGRRVEVPQGSTVLDAIRVASVDDASAVADGRRIVTDSRGLPTPANDRVFAGAIYRLASARAQDPDPADDLLH
jgi:hypothetical protein